MKTRNLLLIGVIIVGLFSIIASTDGTGAGSDETDDDSSQVETTFVSFHLRMEYPVNHNPPSLGPVIWKGELLNATGNSGLEEFQDIEEYPLGSPIGFTKDEEGNPQSIYQVNHSKYGLKRGIWKFSFRKSSWTTECEVDLNSSKAVNFYVGRLGCGEGVTYPSQ